MFVLPLRQQQVARLASAFHPTFVGLCHVRVLLTAVTSATFQVARGFVVSTFSDCTCSLTYPVLVKPPLQLLKSHQPLLAIPSTFSPAGGCPSAGQE